MTKLKSAKRIVVKVGTSTLTYENGGVNFRRIDKLAQVLSDLHNSGKDVILVTSGAIGVGVGLMGFKARPQETHYKQALAAVGQCELMSLYSEFFRKYSQTVGQILVTRDVIEIEETKKNILNTIEALVELRIIPVVNENDTVATDELEGANIGDNDTLSAIVAGIVHADTLIFLTDIDGLYDADPHQNPEAKRIERVEGVTDDIKKLAGGSGSNRGTGGMLAKVTAVEVANRYGIDVVICNGENPSILYKVFEGEPVGTLFAANRK